MDDALTVAVNNGTFSEISLKEAEVSKGQLSYLWDTIRDEVSSEIVEQFGLGVILDKLGLGSLEDYKDGGNVSTVHNADKGIFVDVDHKNRYEKPFDRKNFEGVNNGKSLSDRRKAVEATTGVAKDQYRNGQDAYMAVSDMDIDHVISAKEIYNNKSARLHMTEEELNVLATADKNMAFTSAGANRSKQDKDLLVWANEKNPNDSSMTNAEYYNLDQKALKSVYKKARANLNVGIYKSLMTEVSKASVKQGFAQAKRQAIGVILLEFSKIFNDSMSIYAANWKYYHSMQERIQELKKTLTEIGEKIYASLENWKELLIKIFSSAVEGFTSGVIGTIVTTLINSFMTTFKQWGKILQEGITTFIKAVKFWNTNPNNLGQHELLFEVVKMIGTGLSTSIGLSLTGALSTSLASVPILGVVSDPLSIVLGALISGTLTALVVYSVDNFDAIIKEFKGFFSTVKYQVTVTKEELQKRLIEGLKHIDDAYASILEDIVNKYAELNQLADLITDFDLSSDFRLIKSIEFADKMGASSTEIVTNTQEIDNYFKS